MRVSPQRTEIAAARIKAGLLQKEFADRAGISKTHLQKIELGTRAPSPRIARLAKDLAG